MKQERYKWIKVDQYKVLLDTICNEIVSEIGEVDEIIAFDEFQIVRRGNKFGCVEGWNLTVPIEYDVVTPSEHHKALVLHNHREDKDNENGIHILGKEGCFELPKGGNVYCDDSHEIPIIRIDDKWGYYLYSTDMLSQFEYDEVICDKGFVITKRKNDNEGIECEIVSTTLGYVIASDITDYFIVDEEQIIVKNSNSEWNLLSLDDQWDELYGDSKSFVGIQANPFCRFYRNKNKMITLRKDGMDYIYFPTLRCLSNSYERIVYYGIDIENGQPYAVGYKNGYLAVIYSNSETRCEYNYISSPISNHVLAISSCGGYEGRLKSVCEIINLKRVHEEGGYIFITDTIAWKEYQQLFHDKKLTFEKYSRYEGKGGVKSIKIPFVNNMIVDLDIPNTEGRKEIECVAYLDRARGIDIYSALKVSWEIMGELVEEKNKEYYDDIPVDNPSDAFDGYPDASWNID